ncbi:hypothetical protein ACQP04_13945 [Pseudonocardia halophobica]|uniref:hypothetical protein n=1 Tax=Pseudonocardia halophobica TaxID=29401 RepID=UPI003D8D9B36
MATPRRRTTSRKRTSSRRTTTGRTATGRTGRRSRRRTTTRRRTSTASSLGTVVGAALAGVIATAPGGLAWWGWVLLIVVGLLVGLGYAAVRGRRSLAAEQVPDGPEPSGGAEPA